jgi:hypothetical protein
MSRARVPSLTPKGRAASAGGTLDAAGSALTAGGGSAHLELESARLRRVADCADGDTDHLPQDVAAEQSKLTADTATDAHLGSTTESFIHAFKAKAPPAAGTEGRSVGVSSAN